MENQGRQGEGGGAQEERAQFYLFRKAWGKLRLSRRLCLGWFGLRCSFSNPVFIYIHVQCQVIFIVAAVWLYDTNIITTPKYYTVVVVVVFSH